MRTSLHMLKRGMFNLIEGNFISRYAQAYGDLCKIPQNPLNSHQDI